MTLVFSFAAAGKRLRSSTGHQPGSYLIALRPNIGKIMILLVSASMGNGWMGGWTGR